MLIRKDLQMQRCSTTYQIDSVGADIFEKIKESGGWPNEFNFIGYEHTDERNCFFSENEIRDGWHTTVFSRDEYYWHLLSDKFIGEKIKKSIIKFSNSVVYFAHSYGDK